MTPGAGAQKRKKEKKVIALLVWFKRPRGYRIFKCYCGSFLQAKKATIYPHGRVRESDLDA